MAPDDFGERVLGAAAGVVREQFQASIAHVQKDNVAAPRRSEKIVLEIERRPAAEIPQLLATPSQAQANATATRPRHLAPESGRTTFFRFSSAARLSTGIDSFRGSSAPTTVILLPFFLNRRNTFFGVSKQEHCSLDSIKPYQRPKRPDERV
jgi:hypothetical protein